MRGVTVSKLMVKLSTYHIVFVRQVVQSRAFTPIQALELGKNTISKDTNI